MNVFWLLFSFSGRINRLQYWFSSLAQLFLVLIVAGAATAGVRSGNGDLAIMTALALVGVGSTISFYAVHAKRWHDRDKSGMWSLISFVPIIGPIWMLIECGLLPGTAGTNRFDREEDRPSPLAGLTIAPPGGRLVYPSAPTRTEEPPPPPRRKDWSAPAAWHKPAPRSSFGTRGT